MLKILPRIPVQAINVNAMAYAMNQCWLEHVNIVTQVIQAGYRAEAPKFHVDPTKSN